MSVRHLSQCAREKECVCERREGEEGELRYKNKQMHKLYLKKLVKSNVGFGTRVSRCIKNQTETGNIGQVQPWKN